jgi:hypothetical protein
LRTFGSAGIARSTAPQVVSAIAEIELPTNQWSELIPTLLDNVTNQESALQRQASLQTLGYICESTVSLSFFVRLMAIPADIDIPDNCRSQWCLLSMQMKF